MSRCLLSFSVRTAHCALQINGCQVCVDDGGVASIASCVQNSSQTENSLRIYILKKNRMRHHETVYVPTYLLPTNEAAGLA